LSLSFYGMQVAHIGMLVTAVGIAIVSGFNNERDIKMSTNDTVELNEYRFEFKGSKQVNGPNYSADRGTFSVYKGDKLISNLYPEKRHYRSQMGNAMTEAAIDAGVTRDLFVALGEPLENGSWAVRLQYKPFIRWIWFGCILMALGAILAIMDKRYR